MGSKGLVLISDIHGCYRTLMALLKNCPSGKEVVLLGDLIDRGPRSRQVIEHAIEGKLRCVCGNHEDMMLAHYGAINSSLYREDPWLWNGAKNTLNSYPKPDNGIRAVYKTHIVWALDLPLSIEILMKGQPPLLVSHTGYGDRYNDRFSALWDRHGIDGNKFPDDSTYRVFGHTQNKEPRITDRFAMIDTGCAYKDRGMGKLTAFTWPEKEVIQQINID